MNVDWVIFVAVALQSHNAIVDISFVEERAHEGKAPGALGSPHTFPLTTERGQFQPCPVL